jgi:hypothetical protein
MNASLMLSTPHCRCNIPPLSFTTKFILYEGEKGQIYLSKKELGQLNKSVPFFYSPFFVCCWGY